MAKLQPINLAPDLAERVYRQILNAICAGELAPGARQWWVAGQRSGEPAHSLLLDHLDLKPILDLDVRLGEGTGAVAALPLLFMAARVLAEMSTHEQAGVSRPLTPVPVD